MTTLLVASNGGHLKQLHRLHGRLEGVSGPFEWVTFDTPQARSLLEGETVRYVPFIGGRDPRNVARNLPYARRIVGEDVEALVSTGSAIALPYLSVGRLRGRCCHWIESAARIEGPSLTGRMVSRIPGVKLYAQYETWAGGRWRFRGSVFDSFAGSGAAGPDAERRIARAVVTLGTYKGTPYTRIVRRLREILPPEVEVLWQTGATDVTEFGIDGVYALPEKELSEAMREADVVITHAGVGTALAALEVGKCPLMAPRLAEHGEAVDDHQVQIAERLSDRGLAVTVDAEEMTFEHLVEAAGRTIGAPADPPAFELD